MFLWRAVAPAGHWLVNKLFGNLVGCCFSEDIDIYFLGRVAVWYLVPVFNQASLCNDEYGSVKPSFLFRSTTQWGCNC